MKDEKYWLAMFFVGIVVGLLFFSTEMEGALAGGRPNAVSGGQNAFAGIANPANAVWIPDRWDVGCYWLHQKSSINNHDNNPLFLPGKTSTSYRKENLNSFDAAITKQFKLELASRSWEGSVGLALYSAPDRLAVKTKKPIPVLGTTPVKRTDNVQVFSAIFSVKLNASHSFGFSLDYYNLSHLRKGNQNADNALRSVSPGHVTNNGTDHSGGLGISVGWRWRITPSLDFGLAWIKKSYLGQFRKYRGFEPHHAKNYIPQAVGAGVEYRFNSKWAGRLEVLWVDLGNVPGANNTVLSNGKLNPNKRGSNKSPGPGLQDATLISLGMGYQFSPHLALGVGYSHRLKPSRHSSNFISHPYRFQTIYDFIAVGANLNLKKHDFFLIFTHGFKNKVQGHMPSIIGGGRFTTEKVNHSVTFSWGYLY